MIPRPARTFAMIAWSKSISPNGALPADASRLAALSAGHALVDSYGYALLAPLFPLLAARLHLSLQQVGALPLIMGLSASLGQPLFGVISDRWPRLPAVSLGPAVAALFVGLVGFAPNYPALAGLLFLAGLGIGAYHPQGASLARQAARGRGLAMSAFTVGGNLGFGLAPLLGALYFRWFGLESFYLAALPGLTAAVLLAVLFHGRAAGRAPVAASSERPADYRGLGLLTGTVVVRSAVQVAFGTYLAFLLAQRMPDGGTTAFGLGVAIFLLATAVSGPIGGYLCDRFGRRAVMFVSLTTAPLVLTMAFFLPDYGLVVGLALGGFVLMLPHPANVVMAQEYLPGRTGVAASLITGVAFGLGQMVSWCVGAVADRAGLEPALLGVCWLPLVGVLFLIPLRDPRAELPGAAACPTEASPAS
jgi:FSR family fosmidomycin resistance protein-like MFS transporter